MPTTIDRGTVEDILKRPYRKVIRGTEAEGYLAEAPELPGCITAGETEAEALELLRDAMAAWVESALADSVPIPEPATESDQRHSGRLLVRMPPRLHRRLAEEAAAEQVSINQLTVALLAHALGERAAMVRGMILAGGFPFGGEPIIQGVILPGGPVAGGSTHRGTN